MARSYLLYNHILVKHLRIGLEEFVAMTHDGINDAHSALMKQILGLLWALLK